MALTEQMRIQIPTSGEAPNARRPKNSRRIFEEENKINPLGRNGVLINWNTTYKHTC